MPTVADIIRRLAPDAEIILCADDDEEAGKPGNAGVKAAVEAARAVGGKVALPRPELPREGRKVDFWDVWKEAGPEAVRRAVEAAKAPDVPGEGAKEEEPGPADEAAAFEGELDRLAARSALEYERQRKGAAKRFGVDQGRVDKLVRERKAGEAAARPTEAPPFEETEPWPDPVDPAALLDEIETTIGRFIVCDPPVRTAAALWAAFTWFIDVVQVAPLALITAPEKSCGKSQLLDLFARLARRSMPTSSISPAALYRAIQMWRPALMIDEADAFMRDNEELRGVLNSGHTRSSAFVIRAVGDEHIPTSFSTWGAKAIAGIRADRLAATITDRAVVLPLRRKLKTEKVESLRGRDARELFPLLRRKLARFAQDAAHIVEGADVPELEALNDRQRDNWEPLLAVALAAGGAWQEKAKEAALALSHVEEPTGTGPELLANIRAIFQEREENPFASADRIATADLLEALCENEEWPWATYYRGREITARQVANILKSYGIKTMTKIRIGESTARGYLKADFGDAFSRYL